MNLKFLLWIIFEPIYKYKPQNVDSNNINKYVIVKDINLINTSVLEGFFDLLVKEL